MSAFDAHFAGDDPIDAEVEASPPGLSSQDMQEDTDAFNSSPLYLSPSDNPDVLYAVTRDSVFEMISFFEDSARAQTRGAANRDVATFWAPLGALINNLMTSWNGVATKPELPHLRLSSECALPHNPPCTKPHHPPCNRQHVEAPAKVLVPNTQPTMAQVVARPKPVNPITAVVPNVMQTHDLSQAHLERYKTLCQDGYDPKVAARLVIQDAPRKRTKPSTYTAPKDANKTIYVDLPTLSATDRAKLPSPGQLADALQAHFANKESISSWCRNHHRDLQDKTACTQGHDITLPALRHVAFTAHKINFVFDALIPHKEYSDVNAYMLASCAAVVRKLVQEKTGLSSAAVTADVFHHRSTVVFNNILSLDSAGNHREEKDFIADLYENAIWKGTRIYRANFWHPPHATNTDTGYLFVEFQDNRQKDNLRRVVRSLSRINDDFFPCREVRPSSKPTNLPQCKKCQRWAHLAGRCLSRFCNCAVCAGAHKTEQHNTVAPNAPVKCFNCAGAHHADSTACIFFEKRSDKRWLIDNGPKFDRIKKTWIYYNTRKAGEARTVHAA